MYVYLMSGDRIDKKKHTISILDVQISEIQIYIFLYIYVCERRKTSDNKCQNFYMEPQKRSYMELLFQINFKTIEVKYYNFNSD